MAEPTLEIKVNGMFVKVSEWIFRSWSGERRINGKAYHHHVFYLGTDEVAHDALCGAKVRGSSETCKLWRHHKGFHSTVVYSCDGCGERRRGAPYNVSNDGEGYGMAFCFLCAGPPAEREYQKLVNDRREYA